MSAPLLAWSTAEAAGAITGILLVLLVIAGWFRAEALKDEAERERRVEQHRAAQDRTGDATEPLDGWSAPPWVDPTMYETFRLGRWGSAWKLVVEAGAVSGALSGPQLPIVAVGCKPFRVTADTGVVRHTDRDVVIVDRKDPGTPIRFQAPRPAIASLVDALRRAGFTTESAAP